VARATQAALQAAASWLHSCEALSETVRDSSCRSTGVLGGIAMAISSVPGSSIGFFAVGGLLLMALAM
jgi:hypothetical protein